MTMLHFDFARLLDLSFSVLIAFVLATAIGAERQYRQRSAGLRTNFLVAVRAAAFVSVGARLNSDAGAAQLASYIVSGIGFLGAGVIMKDGSKVWGLNTAATSWCSAAVGTLSRIGLIAEAAVVTLAVLARAQRGKGQLLLVVGDPGLGKSRKSLSTTAHTWIEWSASQLLQNTALHPYTEWGHRRFDVNDPAERRLTDLEATLT